MTSADIQKQREKKILESFQYNMKVRGLAWLISKERWIDVEIRLDELNVPTNMSYKERLAYFQLLGDQ